MGALRRPEVWQMGAVNDIYLLQLRGAKGGQDIVNTLHFKSNLVGGDSGIQQALIDAWQTSSQQAWREIFFEDYQFVDITAQRICGTLPLAAMTVEGMNLAGTRGSLATAGVAPPWEAVLMREVTGFAGRSYAGRTFIPLPADSEAIGVAVQGNTLNAVNAYRTSLASYLAGGVNLDWDLFVRSKKLSAVPGVACQNTGAVVTSMNVSPYLTTMRSRRSRSGA